jgi:hypothetical protein
VVVCSRTDFGAGHEQQLLVHNFVYTAPCNLSPADTRQQMLNVTKTRLAAVEWSPSHVVTGWESTQFHVVPGSQSHLTQYGIPIDAEYARMRYTSGLLMPPVFAQLFGVELRMFITKHMYVARDAVHIVTEIDEIPLVGACVVYTRLVATDNYKLLSRNTMLVDHYPWYLQLLWSPLQQHLRDSLWRNTWALSRAWCGELG